MKLPNWFFCNIYLSIDPRWKAWKDGYVIWLGTEWKKGDEYEWYSNVWRFDFTIVNFGFKIKLCGHPLVSTVRKQLNEISNDNSNNI